MFCIFLFVCLAKSLKIAGALRSHYVVATLTRHRSAWFRAVCRPPFSRWLGCGRGRSDIAHETSGGRTVLSGEGVARDWRVSMDTSYDINHGLLSTRTMGSHYVHDDHSSAMTSRAISAHIHPGYMLSSRFHLHCSSQDSR